MLAVAQPTYLTYESLDRRQDGRERLRVAITEVSDFTVLMTNQTSTTLADSERVFWTGREAYSMTSPREKELSVDFECAVFFLWHTEAVKWVSAMLAAVRPNSLPGYPVHR